MKHIQKFYEGKPCPDPLKGRHCPLCKATYVCLARPKQKKTPIRRREEVSQSKRRARYVIAIDRGGVYLRRTLCVTHHMESGEAQYDTKPTKAAKAPKYIQRAFASAWAAWRSPDDLLHR